MSRQTVRLKSKNMGPLPKHLLKAQDRPESCKSKPMRRGKVLKTGQSRVFVPDREYEFDHHGNRRVAKRPMKKVEWNGKTYYVPVEVCG